MVAALGVVGGLGGSEDQNQTHWKLWGFTTEAPLLPLGAAFEVLFVKAKWWPGDHEQIFSESLEV